MESETEDTRLGHVIRNSEHKFMRNKPDNLADLLPRNSTFLITSLILYYGNHTSDFVMDIPLRPNAIANTCSISLLLNGAFITNCYKNSAELKKLNKKTKKLQAKKWNRE